MPISRRFNAEADMLLMSHGSDVIFSPSPVASPMVPPTTLVPSPLRQPATQSSPPDGSGGEEGNGNDGAVNNDQQTETVYEQDGGDYDDYEDGNDGYAGQVRHRKHQPVSGLPSNTAEAMAALRRERAAEVKKRLAAEAADAKLRRLNRNAGIRLSSSQTSSPLLPPYHHHHHHGSNNAAKSLLSALSSLGASLLYTVGFRRRTYTKGQRLNGVNNSRNTSLLPPFSPMSGAGGSPPKRGGKGRGGRSSAAFGDSYRNSANTSLSHAGDVEGPSSGYRHQKWFASPMSPAAGVDAASFTSRGTSADGGILGSSRGSMDGATNCGGGVIGGLTSLLPSALTHRLASVGILGGNNSTSRRSRHLPHAHVYHGPHEMIANRPRRFIDRIMYRYRKQPWLKGYTLFLICVELLVLYEYFVAMEAANVACSWLTPQYPLGSRLAGGGGVVRGLDDGYPQQQHVSERTPLGDAAFAGQFLCLIIPRVLFYLFYENIAVAIFTAFVHTGEIFHFWSLGRIQLHTGAKEHLAFDQWVVFAFVLVNSPIYILHVVKILQFYFGTTKADRAELEDLAMSSTDSLVAASHRKESRRQLRARRLALEAEEQNRRRKGGSHRYAMLSANEAAASHLNDESPSSPSDLYYRNERPLSNKLYKNIRTARRIGKWVGTIGWNLFSMYSFAEAAYVLYTSREWKVSAMMMTGADDEEAAGASNNHHYRHHNRHSTTTTTTSSYSAYAPARSEDPFFYRSLASEDATQLVISLYVFVAMASLMTSFLPLFKRVPSLLNVFSAGGRYATRSVFEDSEEDEWNAATPATRGSVIGARLPVALIGIAAQLFIAAPLRNAAILEDANASGYYTNALLHDANARRSMLRGNGVGGGVVGSGFGSSSSSSSASTAAASAFVTYLISQLGVSYTPSPTLLSLFSHSYTFGYVLMMLIASGLLTRLWVKALDLWLSEGY